MKGKLFPKINQKQASRQHLEAFMLMATQPDMLKMLESENIIDGVAEKSQLLQRLLIE